MSPRGWGCRSAKIDVFLTTTYIYIAFCTCSPRSRPRDSPVPRPGRRAAVLPRGAGRAEARAARLLTDRPVQAAAPQSQAQRGRSQVAAHSNITSLTRMRLIELSTNLCEVSECLEKA